jgi:hypothetical protein
MTVFKTDDDKRAALPPNLPRCDCFDFEDDPECTMGRCAQAAKIASRMAAVLVSLAKSNDFCKDALPFMVDTLNIVLATHMATQGTAIERGTKEARWETERVLKGIEARLMRVLDYQYTLSDRLGLTEAKVAALRAEGRM